MVKLKLPPKSQKKHVLNAINTMVEPCYRLRNAMEIFWRVTDLYLQGVRNFSLLDYNTGQVGWSWEDYDDYTNEFYEGLPFRYEDVLARVQTEAGILSRLDTSPDVQKRVNSLKSLKNASLGQAILDAILLNVDTRSFDDAVKMHNILYGTVGLGHWVGQIADGFSQEWELIPAWELLGIPANTNNPSDMRAIGRLRVVPLEQLKQNPTLTVPSSDEKLEVKHLVTGSGPMLELGMYTVTPQAGQWTGGSWDSLFDKDAHSRQKAGMSEDDKGYTEPFVELTEIFTKGPGETLDRIVVKAGQAIIRDESFTGQKVPFPIGISRYIDTGHFYGRSFVSKILPFSMRLERLMNVFITNTEDMDRFGYLLVPNGLGIDHENFKNTRWPRVVPYEYDPSMEKEPIQAIQPVSSSDMPGKVAQFMTEQSDKITAQGPLFGGMAPGRVDSAQGIETLAETGSTHLLTCARSIEKMYQNVYRSMLYHAKRALDTGNAPDEIDLVRIDNSMAGLAVNPSTGKVALRGESLPDPWDVDIGIRSSDPVEGERRRQEGYMMYKEGTLPPMEFYIMNYQEGWNYPIGHKSTWENYVKAVLYNLILFADGESPGQIQNNQYIDKPEVQALAIEDFIATSSFALSSQAVQAAFIERLNAMKSLMGVALPGGVPPLDQAAMDQAMTTQAQQAQQKQQLQQQMQMAKQQRPGAGG